MDNSIPHEVWGGTEPENEKSDKPLSLACLDNPNNEQVDFIILTAPWTNTAIPLMAPAALKPVIESAGHTCLAVDINADVYNFTKHHSLREDLIKFFFDEDFSNRATVETLHHVFSTIANAILSWNPKYVGLSLLSHANQHGAKWIAYYIKKVNPSIKIVLGGPGCKETFTGPSDYIDFMLSSGLVDYHVHGDGEHSLYELLVGNHEYYGINNKNWRELSNEDLSQVLMPDYSNYNFNNYKTIAMPILGSRGCIQKCKFCNVIQNWKKFAWRTAADIFTEMQYQSEHYGIYRFKFQDSLVNGNMTEFVALMELIAEHNENNPAKKFSWSGFYVFRNINQRSEYEWEMVSKSGGELLSVGIENLNNDIRTNIGKKFSDEAIDFHLEQALKYNVHLILLNIIGWHTEEQHHIDYIKHWLDTHVQYKGIIHFMWGSGLGIFAETYIDDHKAELGIVKIGAAPFEWVSNKIKNTPRMRGEWIVDIESHSRKLGYDVLGNADNHYTMEKLLKDMHE